MLWSTDANGGHREREPFRLGGRSGRKPSPTEFTEVTTHGSISAMLGKPLILYVAKRLRAASVGDGTLAALPPPRGDGYPVGRTPFPSREGVSPFHIRRSPRTSRPWYLVPVNST